MRLRLTQKLLLYLILISVLPLLALSILSTFISTNLLLDEVQKFNREIVTLERDQLDLILEQIESLIYNVSGVQTIREVVDQPNVEVDSFAQLSTQARIGNILNSYSSIRGLVSIDIFTMAGAHYHVGDTLNVDNINEEARDSLFEQVSAGERVVVWTGIEPNVNAASSFRNVVTAGRLLTRLNRDTMQQEVTALLLVNFSTDELYNRLYDNSLEDGIELMVIDADGLFAAHPDRDRIATPVEPALRTQLTDDAGIFTTVYEGVNVSVSYTRSARTGWAVASITPLAILNAKAAIIGTTTFVMLLLSFGIIAIIALILNRDLVRPIREITHRLGDLQAGKLEQSTYMDARGSDEIADLVRGFNQYLESEKARRRIEQERERLIRELEIAKKRAEESDRLKSEFLSTMSHELRTPLNAIEGFTGIMLGNMGIELESTVKGMVERIAANSSRLLYLINDFLDLTRIESGRMELTMLPISPHDLARRWTEQISVLAEKKAVDFEVQIADSLPKTIYGDEEAISKIVINLLSNAVKFTHEGKVTLSLDCSTEQWSIEVRDTGIGIPPYAREFIFDEFRQVDQSSKRRYGGTGLGLAIVKKLTRAMNGTVTLKSEVGVGSVFTVVLPLITQNKSAKEPVG